MVYIYLNLHTLILSLIYDCMCDSETYYFLFTAHFQYCATRNFHKSHRRGIIMPMHVSHALDSLGEGGLSEPLLV